jgi:hypothetical protein
MTDEFFSNFDDALFESTPVTQHKPGPFLIGDGRGNLAPPTDLDWKCIELFHQTMKDSRAIIPNSRQIVVKNPNDGELLLCQNASFVCAVRDALEQQHAPPDIVDALTWLAAYLFYGGVDQIGGFSDWNYSLHKPEFPSQQFQTSFFQKLEIFERTSGVKLFFLCLPSHTYHSLTQAIPDDPNDDQLVLLIASHFGYFTAFKF